MIVLRDSQADLDAVDRFLDAVSYLLCPLGPRARVPHAPRVEKPTVDKTWVLAASPRKRMLWPMRDSSGSWHLLHLETTQGETLGNWYIFSLKGNLHHHELKLNRTSLNEASSWCQQQTRLMVAAGQRLMAQQADAMHELQRMASLAALSGIRAREDGDSGLVTGLDVSLHHFRRGYPDLIEELDRQQRLVQTCHLALRATGWGKSEAEGRAWLLGYHPAMVLAAAGGEG